MRRSQLIHALFMPSITSGVATTIAVIGAMGMEGWSYVSHNQLFYDALFGPYGITTALIAAPNAFAVVEDALSGEFAYYVALCLGAAIVGVAVYELLGVGSLLAKGRPTLRAATPDSAALQEKLARVGVRALSLLAWACYILCSVSLFMPFITLMLHNGIDAVSHGSSVSGWGQILASAAGLWIGLHVHVIFLRLCLLRPRIFGGWDIELARD